jgi:CDGSH-type Zn-finger protein
LTEPAETQGADSQPAQAEPAGDSARITVTPDGPYLVSAGVPVNRRAIVYSEHGESMTWQTKADLGGSDDVMALCRCGGSASKPFCDGTHARIGFDGTETAPVTSYGERATSYPGSQVEVRDDRRICEHAGFCGNRRTNVWKMAGAPADEDSVLRAEMMSMIEHCPSGALTFRLGAGEADIEPDLRAEVGVTEDGPYFVTGGIPVDRADGQPFETRNRVTLCRCGASQNKPLCDGSHKKAGFRDA